MSIPIPGDFRRRNNIEQEKLDVNKAAPGIPSIFS
jgi:hypothetical protein